MAVTGGTISRAGGGRAGHDMASDPEAATWAIRPARPDERPAVRLLLPRAVHFGADVRTWVAADAAGRVAGAVAVTRRHQPSPAAGPRVAVHVVPPARRSGVGGALVGAAAAAARAGGADALHAWDLIPSGSEAHVAWGRLGFTRSPEVVEARGDVLQLRDLLRPVYAALVARGTIPADAAVVPLADADPYRVADLHVAHLGGSAADVLAGLRGASATGFDPHLSAAIVVGPGRRLAAVSLIERLADPAVIFTHGVVVAPALRGRWANVWLKYDGAERSAAAGVRTIVHRAHEHHADTRRLNGRLGFTTRSLVQPYRTIGG